MRRSPRARFEPTRRMLFASFDFVLFFLPVLLVYWALARRLGLRLVYFGVELNMEVAPTTEELLAIRLDVAPITLAELKQDLETHPGGRIYDPPSSIVQPRRPGANASFDPMPTDVAGEVAQLLASMQPGEGRPGFTHLLTTRRMHSVMNSTGNMLAATLRRSPHNPAYMNPEELAALDLEEGDAIEIASEYGRVEASVASDASLRRGILSIAHCWGAVADEGVPGANVNLLIPCDRHVEPINAMPRMSAVPVRIAKLSAGA